MLRCGENAVLQTQYLRLEGRVEEERVVAEHEGAALGGRRVPQLVPHDVVLGEVDKALQLLHVEGAGIDGRHVLLRAVFGWEVSVHRGHVRSMARAARCLVEARRLVVSRWATQLVRVVEQLKQLDQVLNLQPPRPLAQNGEGRACRPTSSGR